MTLGIGRGMNLNFPTLARLLNEAQKHHSFGVRTLVEATGFHENKVKGLQSWARAMKLVDGIELTPLTHRLIKHDPELSHPFSRGICYVELAANPDADVAHHICQVLLPKIAASGKSTSIQEIVTMLVADGVGMKSKANQQPQRDAALFLASLHSIQGFGSLGLLRHTSENHYITGLSRLGPELTGYAIRRWWPDNKVYLRLAEVHHLISPLLLSRERFIDDVTALERQGLILRITSSGLDQVRPIAEKYTEEALWPNR
jgi:hypothetical protein